MTLEFSADRPFIVLGRTASAGEWRKLFDFDNRFAATEWIRKDRADYHADLVADGIDPMTGDSTEYMICERIALA